MFVNPTLPSETRSLHQGQAPEYIAASTEETQNVSFTLYLWEEIFCRSSPAIVPARCHE